jgi:hypothetical protein
MSNGGLYKAIFGLAGWEFTLMRVQITVNETPEPQMYGRILTGKVHGVVGNIQLDGSNPELRKGLFPFIHLDTTVEHIGIKADWLLSMPMGAASRGLYKACFFSTWFHHFPIGGPHPPNEVLWNSVIGRWPMRLRT